MVNTQGSIRTGFGRAMLELGKKNTQVVALCADLTESLKLEEFKKTFSKQFFEMGICEQNMMSAAAGMALIGKVPFVVSYAVFNPGRNWDQLRVSVCYSNHNVKVIGGHAGLTTGPDGATHQALEDIAITRVLPNLTVVVPCDEKQAYLATLAIGRLIGPCYLRLSREKSMNITSETDKFELGKAQVLIDGSDIAIFGCGITTQFALEAQKQLLQESISCAVINIHTIKPLDEKVVLEYAKKCGAIVSCEEHQAIGGLGSAIAELLAQKLPTPQEFVAIQDSFGESGEGYELLEKYGISTKNIVLKAKQVLKRKKC